MNHRPIPQRRRSVWGVVSAGVMEVAMACRHGLAGTAVIAAELAPTVALAATLNAPIGVALDSKGQIYVANLDGNNVTIYSKQRALIGTITMGLEGPIGVGVATDGTIFVVNSHSTRNITVAAFQGTTLVAILESTTLVNPIGLVVDSANSVWVLDPTTLHLFLYNKQAQNVSGAEYLVVTSEGYPVAAQWSGNIALFGNGNPSCL